MSKLTNEQIQQILDGAPDWAKYFNTKMASYAEQDNRHNLYDLREILTLRQEVELLKALNNGLKAPTARCSTRFICIICGKGGGSYLNIRPPQSYNCQHCESKNTMLPKHVYDAVKAQQSEVAARAVDAQSRIEMVKQFNREQCEAALKVLGLQKSVEKAVNSRLKKLTTKHDAVNQTA